MGDAERLLRLRREYETDGLAPENCAADPVEQFRRWLGEAAGTAEPNATLLSTVDPAGRPSGRYVLLRALDDRGFVFYTNLHSPKARDLAANPAASLTFGWLELHRQVRVSGRAERVPDAQSDAYFSTRPRDSRIGAWASPQSEELEDRAALDRRVEEAERRFSGVDDVPRPPFWGGFVIVPDGVEFWQGRTSRLHDRVRYRPDERGGWRRERLAP